MFTNSSNCDALLAYLPSNTVPADLYRRSEIACIVFNSFLSLTAVMLTSVMIHALWRTSSLPSSQRTLLLSLVASDLGVGAEPSFVCRPLGHEFTTQRPAHKLPHELRFCYNYGTFYFSVIFRDCNH